MKSYSQENLKLVKSFYEAVQRREFTTARNLMGGTVEWIEPQASGLWFGGTHRGPDAVFREVIEPAFNKITDFRVEISQFFQVGEYILATGRFTGRAKTTGKELNTNTAHAWTLRNGKIVRFEAFQDVDAWLDVLGISQEAQRMAA